MPPSFRAGTYTFLFTDIEGSTRLWESRREEMSASLALHDEALRHAAEAHGGRVFKTIGDAFCIAFDKPEDAAAAAIAGQRAIAATGAPIPLHVRMAIHTGTVEARSDDYFGPTMNRIARLLSAAHGEQILLSGVAYELVWEALPATVAIVDLGEHRLRDLARPERVFQLNHPDLRIAFPALRTLESLPNNLPIQATRFVARETELHDLRSLLAKSRLVTVTGPGGAGKTRVALQVAADLLDRYSDGVWLVELASLEDPSRIAAVAAETLGVAEQPGTPVDVTLQRYLSNKSLLLVLDNCEHLVAPVAGFVEPLLRSCPNLRVIATSREQLGVAGEQIYRVPPLETPSHEDVRHLETLEACPSVELFLDRARLVLPAFQIDARNASAIAGICTRLNGVPLALELAASRLKALSPNDINLRLADAFRILTGGSRTALPRQQTLRGTIDWSYNLLEEKERALLCRLSVFLGGWDLAACEAITPDPEGDGEKIEDWEVLDLVSSLVDKSLVSLEERGGQARYRLLETLRQYAAEKLGEDASALKERHLAYFYALAEQATQQTETTVAERLGQRLFAQSDNVRAALHWAMSKPGGHEVAVGFACHLHRTCLMRWTVSEVCGLWDALLADTSDLAPTKELADAYSHASWYAGSRRDVEKARAWAEKGIAIAKSAGDGIAAGRALNALGSLCYHLERLDEAEDYYKRALESVRPYNYPRADISIGLNLGLCLQEKGDLQGAKTAFEAVQPLIKSGNDPLNEPLIHRYLGELLVEETRFELAEPIIEEGLRLSIEMEMEPYICETLCQAYGVLPMLRGDLKTSRERLEEGMARSERLGLSAYNRAVPAIVRVCADLDDLDAACRYLERARVRDISTKEQSTILRSAGWLALKLGSADLAARIAGSARAIRDRFPFPMTPYEKFGFEELDRVLEAALPADQRQRDIESGAHIDALDLISQVLQLRVLTDSIGSAADSPPVARASPPA